ncbi:MAG: hypothetical protein FWG29_11290 [Treponema sp.]|nr:hypothetical protein [Treponema sp.]
MAVITNKKHGDTTEPDTTSQPENENMNETRSLTEIMESIDELEEKIWYNRHLALKEKLEQGTGTLNKEALKDAEKSAEEIRKKYKNNIGPWNDFEWGMLNGKLSALRWVLGDEWDSLDI